jgi:hypothetical protein
VQVLNPDVSQANDGSEPDWRSRFDWITLTVVCRDCGEQIKLR